MYHVGISIGFSGAFCVWLYCSIHFTTPSFWALKHNIANSVPLHRQHRPLPLLSLLLCLQCFQMHIRAWQLTRKKLIPYALPRPPSSKNTVINTDNARLSLEVTFKNIFGKEELGGLIFLFFFSFQYCHRLLLLHKYIYVYKIPLVYSPVIFAQYTVQYKECILVGAILCICPVVYLYCLFAMSFVLHHLH